MNPSDGDAPRGACRRRTLANSPFTLARLAIAGTLAASHHSSRSAAIARTLAGPHRSLSLGSRSPGRSPAHRSLSLGSRSLGRWPTHRSLSLGSRSPGRSPASPPSLPLWLPGLAPPPLVSPARAPTRERRATVIRSGPDALTAASVGGAPVARSARTGTSGGGAPETRPARRHLVGRRLLQTMPDIRTRHPACHTTVVGCAQLMGWV